MGFFDWQISCFYNTSNTSHNCWIWIFRERILLFHQDLQYSCFHLQLNPELVIKNWLSEDRLTWTYTIFKVVPLRCPFLLWLAPLQSANRIGLEIGGTWATEIVSYIGYRLLYSHCITFLPTSFLRLVQSVLK